MGKYTIVPWILPVWDTTFFRGFLLWLSKERSVDEGLSIQPEVVALSSLVETPNHEWLESKEIHAYGTTHSLG